MAADLQVHVTHLKNQESDLAYAVFSTGKGFPGEKSEALKRGFLSMKSLTLKEGVASFVVDGLEKGEYAVSVYQDMDGDRRLYKNFLGIPREPAGVSRNPRNLFGPPSFDDSKFEFPEVNEISIELYH